MIQVSEELKETLRKFPHIKEVHFTANGDHFFNIHELKEKGKESQGFYGWLKYEPIMAGYENGDEKNGRILYKRVHVANPAMKIVESLTREQILSNNNNSKGPGNSIVNFK